MAFPVAAAVAAGASLLSSGGQIYASGKMNKKTREWNEKMYGLQRQDALEDWNLQNSYNSPEQQMARLRAAGLNPNLVYDNGATHTAAPVRSTDVKSWNPETPNVAGIGDAAIKGITTYQDVTLQQEQIKNMEAQRKNMEMDSLLKAVQMSSDQIKLASSSLELDKARALYDTSISTAEEQLRGLRTGTDIKISQEIRDAAMHSPNLDAALQKVANMRTDNKVAMQQIENMKKTGMLDQLEINMRRLGMTFSDPMYLRMLGTFADGRPLPEAIRALWDSLFKTNRESDNPAESRVPVDGDSGPFGTIFKAWRKKF